MGLFTHSGKDIAKDDFWYGYLANSGIDAQLLYKPQSSKLKLGDQCKDYTFVNGEFCRAFLQPNSGLLTKHALNIDTFVEGLILRDSTFFEPLLRQAFFSQGPQTVTKRQKGSFSGVKEVGEPARLFLQLQDEKMKKISPPPNKLGCWPLSDLGGTLVEAYCNAYQTGARIIFDADYTENRCFPTASFWGEVDIQNYARSLGKQHIIMHDVHNKPISTIKIAGRVNTATTSDTATVYLPFLGAIKFGVPGTKEEVATLDYMLIDAQGQEHLKSRRLIGAVTDGLVQAISTSKPVNLENILAMWDFAIKNSLLRKSGDNKANYIL